MRTAMARAEVGDDVYGDDPTVNELERLGADMTGKEASLFVPSGTFGNQLALFTWCGRGSEVILGEQCHIIEHEAGAASVIAGVQTRTVQARDGRMNPADVASRIRGTDIHEPKTSLICLENAHSSGTVVPLANMAELRRTADAKSLPIHLDGARLFNAAASLGVGAGDIAAYADSVMFCLSKGLCAPVGSLLAGPKDFIAQARRKRKIMGGGMRQAGILAAAGLIALKDMAPRLGEDHRRARELALELKKLPGVAVDLDSVQINMVFFAYGPLAKAEAGTRQTAADRIMEDLRTRGILANPPNEEGVFRFVTHYWIGDKELKAVTEACKVIFTGALP
jgi:threonine aldolase